MRVFAVQAHPVPPPIQLGGGNCRGTSSTYSSIPTQVIKCRTKCQPIKRKTAAKGKTSKPKGTVTRRLPGGGVVKIKIPPAKSKNKTKSKKKLLRNKKNPERKKSKPRIKVDTAEEDLIF